MNLKIFLHELYLLKSISNVENRIYPIRSLSALNEKFAFRSSFKKLSIILSTALFTLFFSLPSAKAQNLKGQWIGNFSSAGTDPQSKTDYILEIESAGDKINGFSYTYFALAGKRFYVICRLEGMYDKASKSLVVNEVETLKTNTPPEFQNCLQSHQLTYLKKSDKEILIGKWKPTKIGSDCGKGLTELERKFIEKIPTDKNKAIASVTKNNEKTSTKNTQQVAPTTPSLKKENTTPITVEKPKQELGETVKLNPSSIKNNTPQQTIPTDQKLIKQPESNQVSKLPNKEKEKLLERTKQFIKTIEITGKSFHIDIYDNGQVDGDTVTIFLNEKLLIPSKKLTTSPISIDVKIDESIDTYDITMYAESLGTIPPNTALMIVTTSTDRYEINITSTDQTSGAVRFRVKR